MHKAVQSTEPRTVVATRSYQYNVETVNTDDQEKNYLNQVIVDDVAQQIVRQISFESSTTSTAVSALTMKLDYLQALKRVDEARGAWIMQGQEPLLEQNLLDAFRSKLAKARN